MIDFKLFELLIICFQHTRQNFRRFRSVAQCIATSDSARHYFFQSVVCESHYLQRGGVHPGGSTNIRENHFSEANRTVCEADGHISGDDS
jgi:hypothetical protein